MHPLRLSMVTLLALACLGLTACPFPPKIYRMDVRQGNYLTPQMISKVKIGMNKERVQDLLGTPALTHFFEQERWDYYYYLKPGNGDPIVEKRLSIFFKNGAVVRFEKSC